MASQTMSAADRIRELSEINADVAAMLQSAGKAINSLTNRPLSKIAVGDEDMQVEDESNRPTLDERKEAFTEHTTAYYTTLQAIVARLRRQAYALEESGIIAAEAPSLSSGTQQRAAFTNGQAKGQPATAAAPESERITNGGLGNLDVGWLNSQGNQVGAEKESELVEEAKRLLEGVVSRNSGAGEGPVV